MAASKVDERVDLSVDLLAVLLVMMMVGLLGALQTSGSMIQKRWFNGLKNGHQFHAGLAIGAYSCSVMMLQIFFLVQTIVHVERVQSLNVTLLV